MAIRVKRKAGNRIRKLSTIFDQPSTKDSPGNERQSGQRKTVRATKDNQGNERQSGQRKTVRATKDSQGNERQSVQQKTVRATEDGQGNERQSGQRKTVRATAKVKLIYFPDSIFLTSMFANI